ncbi:hypothetical protein OIV83_004432 [Microbotryomycetes sp. JL201]|nr:hypothetical protein OIV83_004432 [Microbotryomycetes sp. JL201]
MTALTLARTLLRNEPTLPLKLTLIDKARNPGGRMTSRTYDGFDNVTLETGLRVFQASETPFKDEVRRWTGKQWVERVPDNVLKGVAGENQGLEWHQAKGGVTSLVNHLVDEIKLAGKDQVAFHFNTTVTHPSPSSTGSDSLNLALDPAANLEPIDLIVFTAPVPQVDAFVSDDISIETNTEYAQTFVWLLPTTDLPPAAPIYHRNPDERLTSIATGMKGDQRTGIVLQATPQQLGLVYDNEKTKDDDIKRAFLDVLKRANGSLLSPELIEQIEGKKGRESQIKRWKFAQVKRALEVSKDGSGPTATSGDGQSRVWTFKDGKVLIAGDGTDTGLGGVQGAWLAGTEAAQKISHWIISNNARL